MRIVELNDIVNGNYIVCNIKFQTYVCQIYSDVSNGYADFFMCNVLFGPNKRRVKIDKSVIYNDENYEVYESITEIKEIYPEIFI